jgi:hypothetical protein
LTIFGISFTKKSEKMTKKTGRSAVFFTFFEKNMKVTPIDLVILQSEFTRKNRFYEKKMIFIYLNNPLSFLITKPKLGCPKWWFLGVPEWPHFWSSFGPSKKFPTEITFFVIFRFFGGFKTSIFFGLFGPIFHFFFDNFL